MKVAIHQPNFLPWFPFFQKMVAVDVFVFLNRCQFEKGKYQNRFHFRDQWFTMSVNHGLEPITEKQYLRPQDDWAAIKRRLPEFNSILDRLDSRLSPSLYQTNIRIIVSMAEMLGIKTKFRFDPPTELKGTDRLVEICKQLGASTYLAGQSGANYMEPEKFEKAGIKIEYQDLSKADKRHTLEILNERI